MGKCLCMHVRASQRGPCNVQMQAVSTGKIDWQVETWWHFFFKQGGGVYLKSLCDPLHLQVKSSQVNLISIILSSKSNAADCFYVAVFISAEECALLFSWSVWGLSTGHKMMNLGVCV